jgi:hypothetical protein
VGALSLQLFINLAALCLSTSHTYTCWVKVEQHIVVLLLVLLSTLLVLATPAQLSTTLLISKYPQLLLRLFLIVLLVYLVLLRCCYELVFACDYIEYGCLRKAYL